jgi:hypothetical protein
MELSRQLDKMDAAELRNLTATLLRIDRSTGRILQRVFTK